MNKKEEKLFDEEFEEKFGGEIIGWNDNLIVGRLIEWLKNWITEHDKRERERLVVENEKFKKTIEFLEKNVSDVYYEITCGLLSKINYDSKTVLSLFEQKFIEKSIARDDMILILGYKIDKETLEEIKEYFNN